MAKKNASEQKPFQGAVIALTVIVVAAALVWLFVFGGSTTATQALALSSSTSTSDVGKAFVFYNYTSPENGFTVSYPVGFIVEQPGEEELASFRAFANAGQSHPELIEVIVDNQTSASHAFQEFGDDARQSGEDVKTRVYTTSAGKLARVVEFRAPPLFASNDVITEEDSYFVEGFFDCAKIEEDGQKSTYTVLVLGVVPSSLEGDLAVMYHVIDTFKC